MLLRSSIQCSLIHPLSALPLTPTHSAASYYQSLKNNAQYYVLRKPCPSGPLPSSSQYRRRHVGCRAKNNDDGPSLTNPELVVGDTILLITFAIYKQIMAIVLSPNFPGWLAPLKFNPDRFLEFISFATTLSGTWLAVGALVGNYKLDATADLPTALSRVSRTWISTMPVAAAQLVLLVAAKDEALVGTDGFASALPLAASGAGEPFVTAAGVLGLMAVWRAFYATQLDIWNFRTAAGAKRTREKDAEHFFDALKSALLLSIGGCVIIEVLNILVGEERLEALVASIFHHGAITTLGQLQL